MHLPYNLEKRNSKLHLITGIPIRTTLDNSTTVQYAGLLHQLTMKAKSTVRDIDPQNDLTFLRIRSKKHEIMVAPGNWTCRYILQMLFHFIGLNLASKTEGLSSLGEGTDRNIQGEAASSFITKTKMFHSEEPNSNIV